MLIDPLQQFAKRSTVAFAFGGNMSVANVKFHRSQELIEIVDLKTSQCDDSNQVNITADRALVKLDMPSLLDKRFVSSRVKIQGVKIELASLPIQKRTTASITPWQQSAQELLTSLQWENIREDCEALLKSEDLLNELGGKMRGWLLRSQQIMFHGDQLSRTIQGYSNPLRHQNEIRNQLAQIEQLRLEQDSIQKQFNGVNTVLASHLKEVQSLGEQDIVKLRAMCDRKLTSVRNLTAEQVVSEWAKELIGKQLRLSQSIATLMHSENRSNPYNVNIRDSASRTPLFSLSGINLEGSLIEPLKPVLFTATGEYDAVQRADYQLGCKTAWEIQFEAEQVSTRMDLTSPDANSAWSVKSTCTEIASPSTIDLSLGNVVTVVDDAASTMLELDASIDGRSFSGKARMNLSMLHAFAKLPCPGNADLTLSDLAATSASESSIDSNWIEFTLAGSPTETEFTLANALPSDFINAITDSIQKRLETQRLDSESKLKVALNTKVDELSKQIELVAKNGQQTVAKQREALTAVHRDLEQSLQSREVFEYARSPNRVAPNR